MPFVTLGVTVYLLASPISQGAIQDEGYYPRRVPGLSTDPDPETVLGKAPSQCLTCGTITHKKGSG